jgi:hypothetical protein
MTNRNRTLAVGTEIERELCDEVDHPRENPKPAQHLAVGIDGAFVKARRSAAGERRQFEILTGRIERRTGPDLTVKVGSRELPRHREQLPSQTLPIL